MAMELKRKRAGAIGPQKKRRQVVSLLENGSDSDSSLQLSGDNGTPHRSSSDSGGDAEEEWAGLANGAAVAGGELELKIHAGPPQPESKSNKLPTGKDLRAIKEGADLYQSGSFKFQIDELLPNVRAKASHRQLLERFLFSLHSFLSNLTSTTPQHPLEASHSLLQKGVAVPYPHPLPTEDTNWKVMFDPPSKITLVGSWPDNLSVKAPKEVPFTVDLAVEMPEKLFQEKDYLNARYFHKKAFYLAFLAASIMGSERNLGIDSVLFESLSNDIRFTTIVLRLGKGKSSNDDFTKLRSHVQVRIIPVLPTSSPIPLNRLSPSHANLRTSPPAPVPPPSPSKYTSAPLPTPLYNTALLLSFTPVPYLLSMHNLKQSTPAMDDALCLLRVWANQRGYGDGSDEKSSMVGFAGRGAWWSALLQLLIEGEEATDDPKTGFGKKKQKRSRAGRGLSSYQLFRAALDFLAKHDFKTESVFLKSEKGYRFPPAEYSEHHQDRAVFVDSASLVNLLVTVPLTSLEMLRYDAQLTLDTLDGYVASTDPFGDVFLKDRRDVHTRFDVVVRVNITSANLPDATIHTTLEYGSSRNALLASIPAVLRRALGNRVRALAILHAPPPLRPVTQAHPSNPGTIHIGLILDPEHAWRLVDHGPAADDPDPAAAERFRNFWGSIAELRRFKDGRIVESVVWNVKDSDERSRIPAMIVRHMLGHQFGLTVDDHIQNWQVPFDEVLRIPEAIGMLRRVDGVPSGFKGAMNAFDDLVKTLKSNEDDLHLSILNVSPVSEYLRYTAAFAPTPYPVASSSLIPECGRYVPPIEIIIEFEKSAKWPDDFRAIQKIKLAFFERIANLLIGSGKGFRADVVVGEGGKDIDFDAESKLQIVTIHGWAFSARIWHEREATILDRIIGSSKRGIQSHLSDKTDPREEKAAKEARELYTRRFIHAPRHHRAIADICHRFPAFAGTVRLVKRWLASHWLFGAHVTAEAVEIICALIFLGKAGVRRPEGAGVGVPASKERGFSMIVHFLQDWDWKEGVFVPIYGNDQPPDESEIKVTASAGVWKIFTEEDRGGKVWTGHCPTFVTAERVRDIARATCDCLQRMQDGTLNVKTLFTHSTDHYDFLIHLDPSVLPRYFQNITADTSVWSKKGKYANLVQATDQDSLVIRIGWDPARMFFDDLKRIFADTFEVFYDPFGGDCIGGIWLPTLSDARPFKVLGGFSSIPIPNAVHEKGGSKGLVVLNKKALLSEVERLGTGLVKSITIRT